MEEIHDATSMMSDEQLNSVEKVLKLDNAQRIISSVRKRLFDDSGASVSRKVDFLIQSAMSERNNMSLYEGWMSWI